MADTVFAVVVLRKIDLSVESSSNALALFTNMRYLFCANMLAVIARDPESWRSSSESMDRDRFSQLVFSGKIASFGHKSKIQTDETNELTQMLAHTLSHSLTSPVNEKFMNSHHQFEQ